MKRELNTVVLLMDEDFDAKFNSPDLGDWRTCFVSTYARTCRTLELLDCWKRQMSLEDTLGVMWGICFDEYFDGKNKYMPASFYDFCMEVFIAFSDTIDDDYDEED